MFYDYSQKTIVYLNFATSGQIVAQDCTQLPDTIFGCLEELITLDAGVQSGTYFDGVNDFILMDHGAIIGTQAFTISFDAITENNGAMDVITQSCGTDCWADIRCSFNTPQCGLEGVSFKSPAHFATWPFDVSDGNWHTYTYVFGTSGNFSFSNIQVYVDGIHIMEIESTFTFCGHNWGGWTYNPVENPIRIGKGDPLGGFFAGYLRNIGVWNTALDSTYIANEIGQPDISDSTLISYWPLSGLVDGYFEDIKGDNHGLPMGGIEEYALHPQGDVIWFNGSGLPTQQIFSNESGYYAYDLFFPDGSSCTDSIWVEIEPSSYVDLNNNGICDHLDGSGCLDPAACNYDPLQQDSIACVFPVYGNNCDSGAFICADGTVWDTTCQCCVPDISSPPNFEVCGAGTYWDETSGLCLPEIICEEDLNNDGVIGVNDLMHLLSQFGTDCN